MSKPVRIPSYLHDAISIRAEEESRSVANMTRVLLETALASNVKIVPAEPWPGEANPASLGLPEGQGRPLIEVLADEPEPTPEDWVTPTTFARADEVAPDWK